MSTGDRWSAFLKGAERWAAITQTGIVKSQAQVGGFAQRLSAKRKAEARAADYAAGEGEVPLEDAEKAALQAGLDNGEIQGRDAEAAQQKLEEPAAAQPCFEEAMEELDLDEIEKLEQACKLRRAALAQKPAKGKPLQDSQDLELALHLVQPQLASVLTSRFRELAPAYAVEKYEQHVASNGFTQQLLKEIKAVGGLPDLGSTDLLVEHLVMLVDRKEVDLRGMVRHAGTPAGFERGVGSPSGNNCFISSVCQSIQGAHAEGSEHEALCRQIRAAGVGIHWQEQNYIEASSETLQFVAQHLLGPDCSVECWVYASFDGSNITSLDCGHPGNGQHLEIHLFNPVGVHFDPLWKI